MFLGISVTQIFLFCFPFILIMLPKKILFRHGKESLVYEGLFPSVGPLNLFN